MNNAATPKPAPKQDAAETLLNFATKVVTGARAGQYGAAERNLKRIAKLQKALQEVISDCDPAAQALLVDSGAKVALDMIMVKLARICQSPGHSDSFADTAGYASISYRAVYEHLLVTDPQAAADSIKAVTPKDTK